MEMIRVSLPAHLRNIAKVQGEVRVEAADPVTIGSVIDALERQFPALGGTIRDYATGARRPLVRFFVCSEDWSNDPMTRELPVEIVDGREPLIIIGAIAGGKSNVGDGRVLLFGLGLTLVSLWALHGTWKDYDRLQRRPLYQMLQSFRRGPHFPVSRRAALAVNITGFFAGVLALLGFFDGPVCLFVPTVMAMLGGLIVGVVLSVIDYRQHRRYKKVGELRDGSVKGPKQKLPGE